jgi:phosphoribosylformylglycinamidine synthase
VYYQFVYALKGMSDACIKLDTPVTGGNVSFYNQSPDGAVYPTPTIGMVGMLEDIQQRMTMDFKEEKDLIYLVGQSKNCIASSEYLHKLKQVALSPAPSFDLDEEYAVQQQVLKLIQQKLIVSAHDIAEGGLFVTLLESAKQRGLGFDITSESDIRKDAFLFGESQSRIIVSVKPGMIEAFESAMVGQAMAFLGTVTKNTIDIDGESWGLTSEWAALYDEALEKMIG